MLKYKHMTLICKVDAANLVWPFDFIYIERYNVMYHQPIVLFDQVMSNLRYQKGLMTQCIFLLNNTDLEAFFEVLDRFLVFVAFVSW